MLEGFPWVAKLLVILVGMAMVFFLILTRRRAASRAPAGTPALVLTMPSEVRDRIEALRQRLEAASGEPCDHAMMVRMALATLDLVESRDREGWRIILERGEGESERLVLFTTDVADDGVVRTRWDRLAEGGWLDE
jgi:hypothetical protein